MNGHHPWAGMRKELTLAQRIRILYCPTEEDTFCGTCTPCQVGKRLEELEAEILEWPELDKVRLDQLRNATNEITRLQNQVNRLIDLGDMLRNTVTYLHVRSTATEDVLDLLDTWEKVRNEQG